MHVKYINVYCNKLNIQVTILNINTYKFVIYLNLKLTLYNSK